MSDSHDKSEILIVLDLDETLIHATEQQLDLSEDFRVDSYFIYKRPGLNTFLSELHKHYRLAIWSSAGDEYVNEVVKSIQPHDVQFEMVWARSKCTQRRDFDLDCYYWEKRLDKLKKKGFPLEKILIVDDSPEKSRNNYGNAIYILPFTGSAHDSELDLLLSYLLTLKQTANVRTFEKRNWKREKGPSAL